MAHLTGPSCCTNPRRELTSLARLVYRMLKYGQQYIEKGTEYYEGRYRQQQLQYFRKKAPQLGFQIMEAQA